jgi:hypothetical protein
MYNKKIDGYPKGNISVISGETERNHELMKANDRTKDMSNMGKN